MAPAMSVEIWIGLMTSRAQSLFANACCRSGHGNSCSGSRRNLFHALDSLSFISTDSRLRARREGTRTGDGGEQSQGM